MGPMGRRGNAGMEFRILLALIGVAGLAACAEHPEPAQLPQLTSKDPRITRNAQGGGFRTTLSVLTYNVAGLPWPVRTGRDAALHQIGADLRRLQDEGRAPDVVLLQEAFTSTAAHVGIHAGYRNWVRGPQTGDSSTIDAPPPDRAFLDDRNFWKGEKAGKLLPSGLYVFSAYPITQVRMTSFGKDTCAGYDCLANKGVMLAVISIPGVPSPVQVLNTHLNSRGASGAPASRTLYAHKRQIDEMRLFLDQHLRRELPFIYGGDFNTRKSPDRFNHKLAQIPGTVVHVYCLKTRGACDIRMSWDGDAPWLDTQDLQGFASGTAVRVRPIRVEAMFDAPRKDARLSDHDGYLVTYELTWAAAPGARPVASVRVDHARPQVAADGRFDRTIPRQATNASAGIVALADKSVRLAAASTW